LRISNVKEFELIKNLIAGYNENFERETLIVSRGLQSPYDPTDEVLATQRRCHEKQCWYYNKKTPALQPGL